MDTSELHMINDLVAHIETKLGWGNGENWSNKDFEDLSERILKDTKKRLSVTTLKRIWGRAERISNPSSATLDILSEYVGFTNWRTFVKSSVPPETTKAEVSLTRKLALSLALGAIIFFCVLLVIYWPKKQEMTTIPEAPMHKDFSFSNRAVSTGLPNSVVFAYDVSAASADAKIEIQQSWDATKRIPIAREDSIATCIYYHPGFFQSKLVVDSAIVAQEDVFIPTNGWLGTIERDSIPIYLSDDDFTQSGQLTIEKETITEYGLDPRTEEVAVSFYQVQDFGEVYTNDFDMQISLKNTFNNGLSSCQWVQIYLLYEGGAVGIPLGKKGCASEMDIMAFGKYVSGKKNDLSNFGVDFSEFVTLQFSAKNQTFKIQVNGTPTYEMPMNNTVEKIIGIAIHFEGTGIIKQVALGTSAGPLYSFP